MNFDDNITEVFDRYLTGQMTEVEERDFLNQLQNDAALKQAYETHRAIVAGIREARREELKDYIKQNAKIRYIGNIWGRQWVMSSAAILLIMLSAYFVIEFMQKSNNKDTATAETEVTEDKDTAIIEQDNSKEVIVENKAPEQEVVNDSVSTKTQEEDRVPPNINNSQDYKAAYGNKQYTAPIIDIREVKPLSQPQTIAVVYNKGETQQYEYSGALLTLYGVAEGEKVAVYKTDGADYLALKKAYYQLINDKKAHPLQQLKDKTNIKQLPVLK